MRMNSRWAAFFLALLAGWYVTFHPGDGVRSGGYPGRLKPESETGRSGALEALDFWTRARAYPDPDISPSKFYKAYLRSRQLAKESGRSPESAQSWQSIGPTNLPGRTISIAINPLNGNTVYLGSASGGLWRSHTGGLGGDWTRVVTGYPVLGVGAIAIDPQDTNTIFIGTGEVYRYEAALGGLVLRTTRGSYGIGILKTTNGGSTWAKSLDWTFNQERGVEAIRINRLNGNTVLAATTEGLYRSSDRGQTWTQTLPLPMAEDLLYNVSDTSRVLATLGNFNSSGEGLFRSTDGGENWNSIPTFPDFSGKALLESYPPNPNTVYASVADSTTGVSSLWRSGDFGSNWSSISAQDVAGVQGWYSHFVAIKPDDSSRVVRAGVAIYYSTDGGTTITQSSGSYSDHHSFAHHPADPNILYAVNDDGVYRSTNFGVSFTSVGAGMQTGQFYNGFSNSGSDSLLAIGQVQDHIPGYKYGGSLTWTRTALDECGWTAINPLNDNTMFAVNRNGGSVGRSTNRGASFSTVASFAGNGSWNSPLVLSPSDTNVLYMGLDRIYKSTNRGTTWASTNTTGFLDGNLALSMAISSTSPDTLYVGKAPFGARSHLYMTPNGGGTWTDITGSLPDRYPLDLAVDPHDSRKVYAAFGGANSGHVFRSSDAGQNWTDITGTLPDIPTTAVFVDPLNPGVVFAGNDIGVYVSTDAGASWNQFSDGLPDAVLIADLSLSPSNRMLRATTHGNGVYQRRMPGTGASLALTSPNGGESWAVNSLHAITWSSSFIGSVRLDYSTNGGGSWLPVADSLAASGGTYSWLVPFPPTQLARLRITSLGGPLLKDTSDAAFAITFQGSVVSLGTGWNMVSLPVKSSDARTGILFPAASSPAFAYVGAYQIKDTLANGPGYWLRYPSAHQVPVTGDSILADTIAVDPGWNLIGSISVPLRVSAITSSPPGLVISHTFWYSSGYQVADTIHPGQGHWIKTSGAGSLFLGPQLAKGSFGESAHAELERLNRITINDAAGSEQTLYFGSRDGRIDAGKYVMPPSPPGGLDARFASQSMIALSSPGTRTSIGVSLGGAVYPLSIRSHLREGSASILFDGGGQALSDGQSVTIGHPTAHLTLEMQSVPPLALPESFALLQNYPNPFNPSTEIRYRVPVDGRVVLRVYDLLGRAVATLVDERKAPGEYAVRWDAGAMPTGIYYYTLNAGAFHQTRSMALVR
ncbi:MAG TPA: T9SS type A sorting domain-containing protein [Bacteroidota bacterium]